MPHRQDDRWTQAGLAPAAIVRSHLGLSPTRSRRARASCEERDWSRPSPPALLCVGKLECAGGPPRCAPVSVPAIAVETRQLRAVG